MSKENSTENVARKFKIYVILNFRSLYGFHRSHDKKSKNFKKKFCCILPYFYKYIYLNSIFVYYALQLHLRESKPNLCITLSKILRCSWWLSSTVTRSKADALHLCQWLRLNRTFGWSMVHHPNNKAPNQTKPNFNWSSLSIACACFFFLLTFFWLPGCAFDLRRASVLKKDSTVGVLI